MTGYDAWKLATPPHYDEDSPGGTVRLEVTRPVPWAALDDPRQWAVLKVEAETDSCDFPGVVVGEWNDARCEFVAVSPFPIPLSRGEQDRALDLAADAAAYDGPEWTADEGGRR